MEDILKKVLGETPKTSIISKDKKEKVPVPDFVESEKYPIDTNNFAMMMLAMMGYFQVNDVTIPLEMIEKLRGLEIVVSHDYKRDALTVRANKKNFWLPNK